MMRDILLMLALVALICSGLGLTAWAVIRTYFREKRANLQAMLSADDKE